MLNLKNLYQNNREFYEKSDAIDVLELTRIEDYFKKFGTASLIEKFYLAIKREYELLFDMNSYNEAIYDKYNNDTFDGQLYVLIKDGIIRIITSYIMSIEYERYSGETCADMAAIVDWYRDNGFIYGTLQQALKNDIVPFVFTNSCGKSFYSLKAAAEWCIENRLSTGKINYVTSLIRNSILNNKKIYKMNWSLKKLDKLDLSNYKIIFKKDAE